MDEHSIKDKNLEALSKYMSLILRHKPEVIGISLDEHGWAEVDELIAGIAETREFNRDILEEILHKEEKKQLLEAVSQLKGQKKEVILLQYFGDFSQKEIAAMLKITPGNVKVLSYRAKKELKEYLTKEEGR